MTSKPQIIEDMTDIFKALEFDVDRCLQPFTKLHDVKPEDAEELAFWLRTFIRSFFAMVEGVTFTLKQAAFEVGKVYKYSFTPAEIAAITERSPKIQNGKVIEDTMKVSLQENLKFSFSVFARVFEVQCELDTSTHGWQSLRQAIKLRDGLMHPKSLSDLQPFKDFKTVTEAYKWFKQQYTTAMIEASRIIDLKKK
jgi:hypothetical protein